MLDPFEGALDRRAVDVEALGQLAERRLRRLAPGIGDEPDDGRLSRRPAVGVELWIAAIWRPAAPTTRWRFADSALSSVEVAAQRPGDLAGLQLEQGRAGADPAQERSQPCRRSSR